MTNRWWRLLRVLILAAGLAGCASIDKGQTLAEIQAAAREGVVDVPEQPQAAPPPDVSSALMPDVQVAIPGVSADALEQRFDVRVRNAPARDFFMSLVEDTPYNMVVHPEVSGSIDLTLKNVTVPEVLEVVRETYGYYFERTGTLFQVFPNTVQTRIFHVNYPDLLRAGYSVMETSTTGVSTGDDEQNGDDAGTDTTASQSIGSSVRSTSEANFWAQLRTDLQSMVGTEAGQRVSINPLAGLVVVRARPDELRDVARFLEASAEAVERQVILEARILEVTLAEGYRAGINWAEIANAHGELAVFGPGGNRSGTLASQGIHALGDDDVTDITLGTQVASALSTTVTDTLTLGLFGRDFAAFIDVLKTQGDVQVLSSPRVSTVNNQKAVIKVGSDEFFVTDVDSNTTTGTATTTNVSVELTPFFSGVSLDVTPQISPAGEVILHIHPTVSEVSEQTKNINTTAGSLSLPLAASTIRESDSVIRAHNGQIVVIGGLMQNRRDTEHNKVPVLGDIPLLGGLFRHSAEAVEKTELVILLKPSVVDSPATWSRQLRESVEAFEGMEQDRSGGWVKGAVRFD